MGARVKHSRPPEKSRARFGTVVARLTAMNSLLVLFAFVTSPILARTLGPVGRGEVAAVFAVASFAPWISELGMTSFLSREHARREQPLGVLLGSAMPIALAGSLVGVTLAIPLAHALGRDRNVVIEFVELGLFLLPVTVFAQTLYGVAVADQRWGVIMLSRFLLAGGSTLSIVVLSVLDDLTVTTATATYVVGGIVACIPFLVGLRGSWPWQFARAVARSGLAFGVRSWLSALANSSTAQLDQVLMAGLVSSRQLGLYSLAVTITGAANGLVSATANAVFPRVAAGESELVGRACRVTCLLILVFGVCIGATSPLVVPFVFGSAFTATIPMLVVLLSASLFFVPGQVLGSALIAGGNPGAAARGQFAGLAVTVPGLIVLVPTLGGLGAAWVSFASYCVTFGIVLTAAVRTFGLPYRTLLIATGPDLRWMWRRLPRWHSAAA